MENESVALRLASTLVTASENEKVKAAVAFAGAPLLPVFFTMEISVGKAGEKGTLGATGASKDCIPKGMYFGGIAFIGLEKILVIQEGQKMCIASKIG